MLCIRKTNCGQSYSWGLHKGCGDLGWQNFRNFRSSPMFPKELKMCYGCWAPGNVCVCLRLLISTEFRSHRFIFANSVGLWTRLVHQGQMGHKCTHRWTFPSVVYVVFNDQDLREWFSWSVHDTLGITQASDKDMMGWLQTPVASNDIPKILMVVEFMLELRGMPRMCAMLRAVWCFTRVGPFNVDLKWYIFFSLATWYG